MPPRPRPSKITKPNGNPRGRKALPDEAQHELEHYGYHDGRNGNASDNIASPARPSPGMIAPPQNSPLSNAGGDDYGNFRFTARPGIHQYTGMREIPTTAEVAFAKYGDAVKIDSALCKKVAPEQAQREPVQRRPEQRLNIERRSNMEAFMAHVAGRLVETPCKNCHKGHGPWKQCVVYEGQMCGSCTNCWYNASGSRCTFHGNAAANHAANTSGIIQTERPAASSNTTAAETLDETGAAELPYYSPAAELERKTDWEAARPDMESSESSQSQPHTLTPLPVQTPTFMNYQPPPMTNGMPNMGMILGGSYMPPWASGDPTGRLISQAMGDVALLSRRDRYIARIETAAEELAMRIAEYNEYMHTPEGMAEQPRMNEPEEGHFISQGHAHDAAMDTASVNDSGMS